MSFSTLELYGYLQLTQQVQIRAAKSLLSTLVPLFLFSILCVLVCCHLTLLQELRHSPFHQITVALVSGLPTFSPVPYTATKEHILKHNHEAESPPLVSQVQGMWSKSLHIAHGNFAVKSRGFQLGVVLPSKGAFEMLWTSKLWEGKVGGSYRY